ncbi:sulfocyanin-like copper-binding protein [Streptomyces sp. NPDC002476]|uniref:sulfocyanin-like copper-binding protein n=1 Tax=Streptomyces sp. NPDC002476 TaxID=3364648 RepID=UPI0036AE4D69
MMRLIAHPTTVTAGTVSLRAVNAGYLTHEVMVLPLSAAQAPGQRPTGPDRRIDETGNLGEASRSCGAGAGDGIAPGTTGWITLTLRPGRYELVCNIPGHYLAGMYTELDVTGR